MLTIYFFKIAIDSQTRMPQVEVDSQPQAVQTQKQPLHKMVMPVEQARPAQPPVISQQSSVKPTSEPNLVTESLVVADAPTNVSSPSSKATAAALSNMNFVVIPAGEFLFGSHEGDPDEHEVKRVSVASFSMATTEVTRAQFAAFVSDTGYMTTAQSSSAAVMGCYSYNSNGTFAHRETGSWRDLGFAQSDNHPVSCVSIDDALAYIEWLNTSNDDGVTYRLPTEVEWEYAAKAQSGSRWHWGNETTRQCEFANGADLSLAKLFTSKTTVQCSDGFQFTAPVASYKPNRFGLYDMGGNVWEWTSSCYTFGDYASRIAWPDQKCAYHTLKGGSFINPPRLLRHANKDKATPTHRLVDDGFRLAFSHS